MGFVDAFSVASLIERPFASEFAIIDSRGEVDFASGHMFHASSVPVDRLETTIGPLIPRRDTRVIVVDDDDGSARLTARLMGELGFSRVDVLDGGVAAWSEAGFPLYDGMNVPAKALGAALRSDGRTPTIAPGALHELMQAKGPVTVVDCRTRAEFLRGSIPGAVHCPGERLPLSLDQVAADPDALVVVTCAGRTRSVVTTRSLMELGKRRVVALDGGTMAWQLAGFDIQAGSVAASIDAEPDQAELAREGSAIVDKLHPSLVTREQVSRWIGEDDRTTLLLDVRSPAPADRGSPRGLRSAPATQLLLAVDRYIAVHGARVVLVDDDHLIVATLVWRWLARMGIDVHVMSERLDHDPLPGTAPPSRLGSPQSDLVDAIAANGLLESAWMAVDVSASDHYRTGHLPGSTWVRRMDLSRLPDNPMGYLVVGDDDHLARIHADEISGETRAPAVVLKGGVDSWRGQGLAVETGDTAMLSAPRDRWIRPSEMTGDTEKAMREYLDWGDTLLERVVADPQVGWLGAVR